MSLHVVLSMGFIIVFVQASTSDITISTIVAYSFHYLYHTYLPILTYLPSVLVVYFRTYLGYSKLNYPFLKSRINLS